MLLTNVPFNIEKSIPFLIMFRQLKLLTMLTKLLRNALFDDVLYHYLSPYL
jgi:hypothetical protein